MEKCIKTSQARDCTPELECPAEQGKSVVVTFSPRPTCRPTVQGQNGKLQKVFMRLTLEEGEEMEFPPDLTNFENVRAKTNLIRNVELGSPQVRPDCLGKETEQTCNLKTGPQREKSANFTSGTCVQNADFPRSETVLCAQRKQNRDAMSLPTSGRQSALGKEPVTCGCTHLGENLGSAHSSSMRIFDEQMRTNLGLQPLPAEPACSDVAVPRPSFSGQENLLKNMQCKGDPTLSVQSQGGRLFSMGSQGNRDASNESEVVRQSSVSGENINEFLDAANITERVYDTLPPVNSTQRKRGSMPVSPGRVTFSHNEEIQYTYPETVIEIQPCCSSATRQGSRTSSVSKPVCQDVSSDPAVTVEVPQPSSIRRGCLRTSYFNGENQGVSSAYSSLSDAQARQGSGQASPGRASCKTFPENPEARTSNSYMLQGNRTPNCNIKETSQRHQPTDIKLNLQSSTEPIQSTSERLKSHTSAPETQSQSGCAVCGSCVAPDRSNLSQHVYNNNGIPREDMSCMSILNAPRSKSCLPIRRPRASWSQSGNTVTISSKRKQT